MFFAGVGQDETGKLIANGGRVMALVATAPTVAAARRHVYAALQSGEEAAGGNFDRLFYRHDIAVGE